MSESIQNKDQVFVSYAYRKGQDWGFGNCMLDNVIVSGFLNIHEMSERIRDK